MSSALQERPQAIPSFGYGDYMWFSKFLQDYCGLHFPVGRRADLESGVRRAFAASTCSNLNEYYHLLQDPQAGALEIDQLINAVTVSESHFFRNAGLFDALYRHVLPQIIERRLCVRTLRIWSAGCASGEEPYSVAMLLYELLPDIDDWSITILATDINTGALTRARQGIYRDWAFREKWAKQWQRRYFRPHNEATPADQGQRYELTPEIRRLVTFVQLNLANNNYPAYETNTMFMDLILCRNVTIYFAQDLTARVVDRFYEALVDGGWLAVGHSEHSLGLYHHFRAHSFPNAVLYQRLAKGVIQEEGGERQNPSVEAVAAPSWPDAQPTWPTKTEVDPSDPQVFCSFERARELLNLGHSEQARGMLLKLIESDKDAELPQAQRSLTYTLLGQACANLGYWQEAGRWCHQALRWDELSLEAYYVLALVLQHQDRLEPAIDAMKKVVYIDRENVLGHFGLANLYHSNGQLPRAQKSLDNARRLLETRAADELIPGSGGITVGRLRQAIIRQQQRWRVELNGLNLE